MVSYLAWEIPVLIVLIIITIIVFVVGYKRNPNHLLRKLIRPRETTSSCTDPTRQGVSFNPTTSVASTQPGHRATGGVHDWNSL